MSFFRRLLDRIFGTKNAPAKPVVSALTHGVFCAACLQPHDLNEAPDEGVCLRCGGPLQDADDEVTAYQARAITAQRLQAEVAATMGALRRRYMDRARATVDRDQDINQGIKN